MGGKCMSPDCPLPPNLVLPPRCFDFHHINRGDKTAVLNHLVKQSWSATVKELRKCIMLCCLCHRLLHAREDETPLDGESESFCLIEADIPI